MTREIGFIKTDSRIEKSLTYFVDDVHYTQEGAEKIAEIVSEYIVLNALK